jgi:hypothetical protein
MNKSAKKSQVEVEVEVEVEVAQDSVIAHPRTMATCRFLPAPSRAFSSEIFLVNASGSRAKMVDLRNRPNRAKRFLLDDLHSSR